MKTCGDFGGRTEDGSPCSRVAGWGRSGASDGPCRTHVPVDPAAPEPLVPLHDRFVDEYMVDMNAAAAYRRAGGSSTSARQLGHELLKRPDVQAAIQRRREQLREEVGVRQQRVIEEYAALAFSDIRNVVKWGKRGGPKLATSSDELDDVAAAAIAEVRKGRDGIVVKLHSKTDALAKLGQHLGMFVDRSFNFDIDWHSLPEEALERIMAGENPITVLISILQNRDAEAGPE